MHEKDPVPGPENELDPGASTQVFQAFVDRREQEATSAPRRPRAVLVGAALVGLLIVVVLAWLVLGG